MSNRTKRLGTEKIGKLLLENSIPAIIATFVSALYNVVDRIFIGQGAGELALSGVSLTFPVFIITIAFGMFVGMGSGSLISIRLGQNRKDEAERILGNAFFLFTVISIAMSVLGLIFLDPFLTLFGASENTLVYAKEYMYIILPGVIFNFYAYGMNNQIRSEGSPKTAMKTTLIGAILNIILDPIFIFVFDMGVRGAAIATVISQFVSSSWVIYHFTLSSNSILKLRLKNLRFDLKLMMPAFMIGLSPFFIQLAQSFVSVFYNKNLLTFGGDLAIGAMGIVQSVSMFILMIVIGINQGAQPIIGYNFGAEKPKRVKDTLILSLISATVVSTLGFIVVEAFPEFIIGLFSRGSSELRDIGVYGIRISFIAFFLVGFQIIASNFFQAVNKPKVSIFLSLSRQVILLIPLLFILPKFFGITGVWIVGPITDFLSAIIAAFFLVKEIKKLNSIS